MFIGHFAMGYAAKNLNPRASLGTYFLAAQFLDLLWPTLLLLNIEKAELSTDPSHPVPLVFTSYPFSHSLALVLLWGLGFGLVYFLFKKHRATALLLFFVVISHWLLDLVVHIPDLPLWPGNSPLLGFGLWKSKSLTLMIEMGFFIAAVMFYFNHTKPLNNSGRFGTWGLVIFLIIIHLANLYGPLPKDIDAVAWAGHLQWIFVIWAYWSDQNRKEKKMPPLPVERGFGRKAMMANSE
jgi:FtsH-binding integral membrane protein